MCNCTNCKYYSNVVACIAQAQPQAAARRVNITFPVVDSTGCPVRGAVYRLSAADGQYVNAISGQNGCVTFCGTLLTGDYTLQEVSAPYGYQADPAAHTVEVNACGGVAVDGNPLRCFRALNPQAAPPAPEPSVAPTINTVASNAVTVSGAGVAGCYVEVTWPNGATSRTAVLRDGTWSLNIPPQYALQAGDTIQAVQNCCGKSASAPVTTVVVAS